MTYRWQIRPQPPEQVTVVTIRVHVTWVRCGDCRQTLPVLMTEREPGVWCGISDWCRCAKRFIARKVVPLS